MNLSTYGRATIIGTIALLQKPEWAWPYLESGTANERDKGLWGPLFNFSFLPLFPLARSLAPSFTTWEMETSLLSSNSSRPADKIRFEWRGIANTNGESENYIQGTDEAHYYNASDTSWCYFRWKSRPRSEISLPFDRERLKSWFRDREDNWPLSQLVY